MKTYLLLILLITNTLQSQTTFSQASGNQLDYFKSNLNDLKDENGNSVLNSIETDSLVLTGEAIDNYFGYSVSSAGDVNGDGYFDIIVGAYGYGSNKGRVYIFYGGYLMDDIADVVMTGEAIGDLFGSSVCTAGDVNGDGYSDVIVGGERASITHNGCAYIFYGDSSMNNIADVTMTGEVSNSFFGSSVCTAGDVNGDGYSDVIVGAYRQSSQTSTQTGQVFVFYGGSSMNNAVDINLTGEAPFDWFGWSVSTAGDVNGDGFSDIIVGAWANNSSTGRAYIFYGGLIMNNATDVTLIGVLTGSSFGRSVSNAGDVNGDGYSDVIVGAFDTFDGGQAYVFFGGSSMNNIADVTMTGEETNSWFGWSVSNAGDINSDGYSDVIVGAVQYGPASGRSYIFYGGLLMNNVADVIMTGEANSQFGNSVSYAGYINGDGYLDVIVGSPLSNINAGRAYIFTNIFPKPELINPINNSINNPVSINFKWKKLNTTIYYILIVSTDSVFNNIIVNDTILIDTSKTVSGFQKDKKYFWRVKAKGISNITYNSSIWNFTTIPPIYSKIKLLFEGMYFPLFNQMTRRDTITAYLYQSTSPYIKIDSTKSVIDSISFSGVFNFLNATAGTYYIVVKHFNSIETWSKTGGESLVNDGTVYNYDFTTSASKAYGNNQKLKGGKYCIYSGDVNQDGLIDITDFSNVVNDSYSFVSGRFVVTDLNGDTFVDLTDITFVDNNSYNYISIIRP